MTLALVGPLLRHDPPLTPSGDDGRSELRRELLHPEYHQHNLLQEIARWVQRRLQSGVDAASQAPPLSTLAAMIVFVALALALAWLVSRARRTARSTSAERPVLTGEAVTADELRARAEAALAAQRYEEAVVEGFRAMTLRQVERGRLPDAPGATAHEVAVTLAADRPAEGERVIAAAAVFDAVLYGDRQATREQAEAALGLDRDLVAAR